MKRHISRLSRHLSDAYKDVRGGKVTMKEGKYALHRPCCLLYTDANIMIGEQDMARAEMVKTGGCGT